MFVRNIKNLGISGGSSISQVSQATNVTKSANKLITFNINLFELTKPLKIQLLKFYI